jgi:hypothetical protein
MTAKKPLSLGAPCLLLTSRLFRLANILLCQHMPRKKIRIYRDHRYISSQIFRHPLRVRRLQGSGSLSTRQFLLSRFASLPLLLAWLIVLPTNNVTWCDMCQAVSPPKKGSHAVVVTQLLLPQDQTWQQSTKSQLIAHANRVTTTRNNNCVTTKTVTQRNTR